MLSFLVYLFLNLSLCLMGWTHALREDHCPSSQWNVMCRPCCEYHLIECQCPSKGTRVGYTVPCCRNALDECDPCIVHPGCSLFENCKTCNNGTWSTNDDFFVNGKYCTECRQGWSGGDCKTCGGVIQRAQGHIALESYPTNARCEWIVQMERGSSIQLRFSLLGLESDHSCRYDYLELRDGDSLASPVIGRFCGDQLPPPIKSSGNFVHILFTSDGYNNLDGFVLTFQEISGDWLFSVIFHLSQPEHFFTVSTIKNAACAAPDKPVNGYLLPVYGPKEELVLVNYRCHPPFRLIGTQQRTCLPNGTWSGTAPSCQTGLVRCAPPPKPLHGYHRPALDSAGGAETIEFFCKTSYILSGNHQSTCLSNGSWSSRSPKCVRVCREPNVSKLVRQSVVKPQLLPRERSDHLSSRYSVDDLLSAGFIPLTSGGLSSEKNDDTSLAEIPPGFHPVHTSIDYKCVSPLYRNKGSSRRTCLKTGRWSGQHVSCSPVCGKFDTFNRHNLSDTQWPWHAAIFIRSLPDYPMNINTFNGGIILDDRWASQDSTFWSLACSGALVAQDRVLVAARCVVDEYKQQPFDPEYVKVVIRKQYHTASDVFKSQHHLRVSEIVVHPNFFSSPDSDVAVLKLKDKAKIREHMLPVCLPKTQGGEVTAREAYTARWILPNAPRYLRHFAALSLTKLVALTDVTHCEREFAQGGAHTTAISDNSLCVISKLSSPQSECPTVVPGITIMPAVFSSTRAVLSGHEDTHRASSAGWQLLGLERVTYFEVDSCDLPRYTVHTQIANFQEWIEQHVK